MLPIIIAVQSVLTQTFPPGFAANEVISSGLSGPTCFCIAPDGRIFIAQKNGAIRIWKEGEGLLTAPFHTFPAYNSSERGLIGMALDPDFKSNGRVYVHYNTSESPGFAVIARVAADPPTADVADTATATVLFQWVSTSGIHKGGAVHFGTDGKLYVTVGDHANGANSQSLANLYGKVLRLNADGTIPEDNPTSFPGIAGSTSDANKAIWAVELRNPFTHAFQPGTGRMFINDVGGSQREEVNEGAAGANYGWPQTEGDFEQAAFPAFTRPVHAYPRTVGSIVTGGAFYTPPVSPYPPAVYNGYLFGDAGAGWMKRLDLATGQVTDFGSGMSSIVGVRIDDLGRVWYLRYGSARLARLDYTEPLPPAITAPPVAVDACVNAAASFSVSVSGTAPLTYQWRRNGIPLADGGAMSGAQTGVLTLAAVRPADAGVYDCVVQNVHGSASSAGAELTVGGGFDGGAIPDFVAAVLEHPTAQADRCRFDADGNGVVDMDDASALIDALVGQ